jgi:hypothetical protein
MTVIPRKHKPLKHKPHWITHEHAMARQQHALDSMHPVFRLRVSSILDHLTKKGWMPFVFQGKDRTPAQAEGNAKTGVGIKKSWHRPDVQGRLGTQLVELFAADIVDERWGWEGPVKHLSHPFWKDLGGYAQAEGLEWGGTWKKKDVAHVQMALIEAAPSGSALV